MITTYSGLWVDPLNLQPNQVTIRDIAYPLAHICRFGGHVKRFYSVAEHCLIGSRILEKRLPSNVQAIAFLMHDAAEAFIGDIVGPIKKMVKINDEAIDVIETRLLKAIFKGLGLPDTVFGLLGGEVVKNLDTEMCQSEQRVLTYHHKQPLSASPIQLALDLIEADRTAKEFIERFYELSYSIAER